MLKSVNLKRNALLGSDKGSGKVNIVPQTNQVNAAANNVGGLFGGIGYLGEKVFYGFLSGIEGIVDYTAGGIAKLAGNDKYAERLFATDWADYDHADEWFNPGEGWQFAGQVASGIGTSLPAIGGAAIAAGVTVLTGGAGTPVAAAIATGVSASIAGLGAAGNATKEAYQQSGQLGGAEFGYGALSGVTEAALEAVSGGLAKGSGRIIRSFTKQPVKEASEVIAKTAGKQLFKQIGEDFAQEAFEEGMSEFLSPYFKRYTYDPSAQNATAQELFYAAMVGGFSGAIMSGGASGIKAGVTSISDLVSGNNAYNSGTYKDFIRMGGAIANYEATNNTEIAAFQNTQNAYKKLIQGLQNRTGISDTNELIEAVNNGSVELKTADKVRLGELKNASTTAIMQPFIERSAIGLVLSSETAAKRFSSLGLSIDGKPINITSEEILSGIDPELVKKVADGSISKAEYKTFTKQMRAALSTNSVLATLSVAEATGSLMIDSRKMVESMLRGENLANGIDISRLIERGKGAELEALGNAIGVSDWSSATTDEVIEKLEGYSGENAADIIESLNIIRDAVKSNSKKAKPLPHLLSDKMSDGATRYVSEDGTVDIAIYKDGDRYHIYDYSTEDLSRSLTRQEVNRLLNNHWTKKDTNAIKRAAQSETAAQLDTVEEIANKIPDYKKLNAQNRTAIRTTIRQALVHGATEAETLTAAMVSIRSGLNIIFDKNMPVGDGYLLGNTIHINPKNSNERTYEVILGHEMFHKLFASGDKKALKLYKQARKLISDEEIAKVEKKYKDFYSGTNVGNATAQAISMEEAAAAGAEIVFKSADAWQYILSKEPSFSEKVLSFFRKSARDYSSVQGLSAQARKFVRQYKALFESLAERNQGNNALSIVLEGAGAKKMPVTNTETDSMHVTGDNDEESPATTNTDVDTDIRFALTDEAYLAAVESGDMDTAQRMVDEAAKNAGYDVTTYHGTDKEFTVFKTLYRNEFGYHTGTRKAAEDRVQYRLNAKVLKLYTNLGKTIRTPDVFGYFAGMHDYIFWVRGETDKISDMDFLKQYGRTKKFKNTFPSNDTLDRLHSAYVEFVESGYKGSNANAVVELTQEYLKVIGVDSIAYTNAYESAGSTSYLLMDSNRVKSADPVTYDDAGKIIPLSKRFSPYSRDIRFALPETDSNGETLTEAQREYFADSKVLDENGNLLALYHGTPKENGEFYVFDNNKAKRKGGFGLARFGKGFYFTTEREAAEVYTRSGGRLLSVYVDIKNPYIVNGDIKEQISNDFGIDPLNVHLQEVQRILSSKGYDGIIYGKGDAHIVVAYYPEQIKLTSNKNPTADPDVRYALPENDSTGAELTSDQRKYFDASKQLDSEGRLQVMYQGAPDEFFTFDKKKSKPSNLYGRGFYFTNSADQARHYGTVRGYYLNITNPLSATKKTISRMQMRKFLNAVAENEDYSIENYGTYDVAEVLRSVYEGKSDFAMIYDVSLTAIGDLVEAVELFNEINGTEYDGFILDTESVIFRSEQAKLTTNTAPSSNPDTRYALPDTTASIRTELDPEYKPTIADRAFSGYVSFQIAFTNAQAGIEAVGKRLGMSNVESLVQAARSAVNQAEEMIGGFQWRIGGDAKTYQGEGLEPIMRPIYELNEEDRANFYDYLFHYHNISRMSLEERSMAEQKDRIEKIKLNERNLEEIDKLIVGLQDALENETDNLKKKKIREKIKDQKKAKKILETENRKLSKLAKEFVPLENKPVFEYTDENGNKVIVTSEESKSKIREYENTYPEFKGIAEKLWAFLRNLNRYRVDTGLISEDTFDYLAELYPHYVPTYRAGDPSGIAAVEGKSSIRVKSTVKTAKGSTRPLLPPDKIIARQVMETIRAGRINQLANAIYDAAVSTGDTTYIEVVSRKKVSNAELAELDLTEIRPKNNQITFFRNGEQIVMRVSKEVFTGFDAFSSDENAGTFIWETAKKMNNGFKRLVTSLNPAFLVRNTIRDLQDAGINSKYAATFMKNYARAINEIKTNGGLWKLYRAMGGFSSSIFDMQHGFDGKQNKIGLTKLEGNLLKKTLQGVENANAFVEQLPRLAEFISSIEAGNTPEQAILDSAEVTTNFGRSGTIVRKLNQTLIPFLNPAIQGFSKMIRNITTIRSFKEFLALLAKVVVIGVVPMVLNMLMYGDDEDYKDLRDNDKENNFLFKIGDNFIKIPRGRVASVIGGAVNRGKATVSGEDADWIGYIENAFQQVTPVDSMSRTIFSPFKDVANNVTWYGSAIEGRQFENTAPKDRYDESTSSIAILMSKALYKISGDKLGLSPKKIHYLLDQYSGVIGDFILPATTAKAEKGFLSGNFTIDPATSNKLSTKFYDMYDQAQYAKTSGNDTAKYQVQYLNKVKKAISEMYKEKSAIQNNTELSNAEKMDQTRVVQILINEAYKTALQDFDLYTKAIEATALMSDESLRFTEATRLMYGAERALSEYNEDVYAKCQQLNKAGIDYETLYNYYFTVKDITSDIDSSGSTVSDSKRKKVVQAINKLNVSNEQKLLLICAKGYSLKDNDVGKLSAESARKKLLNYILKLKLSKEEKASIAQLCGFTVKNGSVIVQNNK